MSAQTSIIINVPWIAVITFHASQNINGTSDSTSEADEDEQKDTIAENNPISSHHDVAKKVEFNNALSLKI